MADKKYNSIEFCPDNYIEYNDYLNKDCVDFDAMYADIGAFIRIALKNDYQLKLWTDGYTTAIEYNSNDPGMGDPSLVWVGDDQFIVNELRCEIESITES